MAVQAAVAAQQAEDRAARQLLQKGRLLVNWMAKGERGRLRTPEDFARTAASYQVVEELIDLGRGRSSDNLFFRIRSINLLWRVMQMPVEGAMQPANDMLPHK